MIDGINKRIVAHEFGHIVASMTHDNFLMPSRMVLKKDGYAEAYTLFDDVPFKNLGTIKKNLTNVKNLCNLGGIFGELLVYGSWTPWQARQDLDEFVTLNIKRQKLVKEIVAWMWLDTDPQSFVELVREDYRNRAKKIRNHIFFSENQMVERLPLLHSTYCDFLSIIHQDEFKAIVNEIYADGRTVYTKRNFAKFAERVIL